MEQWISPNFQVWTETIETLGRFAVRYPHMDYAGIVMLLQVDWQYIMWTAPGVGEYMGLVKEALKNCFSAKTTGTVEHLREAEECTVPRSQEVRDWDIEPNRNGR